MKKNNQDQRKFNCDLCGSELEQGKSHYILDLKLYASPEIIVEESDFYKNTWNELKKIAYETKNMNEQDLQEEVYFECTLNLCKVCRDILMIKIKRKELI
jgi:hypothetical protein